MSQEHQDGDEDIQSDKKKQGQRELKRTTSFIPRATTQRSKTPAAEVKKSGRKSDTSLKNKEIFEDGPAKEKKFETSKNIKTIGGNIDGKTNIDTTETKKTSDGPRVFGGTVKDNMTREQSATRATRGVHSRIGHTLDGFGRLGDKIEGKGGQKGNVSSAVDDSGSKTPEAQYSAKRTVYRQMVKEFEEKQKALREQYKALTELRRKVHANTGREMSPEEKVRIDDIGPPFVIDHEALTKSFEMANKRAVITFETKVFSDINVDYTEFQNVYEAILHQSRETWLSLIPAVEESGKHFKEKLMDVNPDLDIADVEKDEKSLELAIENAKYYSKLKTDELAAGIKKLFASREILKQELKTLMDGEKISALISKDYKDIAARLNEVEEELVKEKIRTESLMDKRNSLEEANLADAEKIENLEQTISEQQNQLEQLSYQFKSLKNKELLANRGLGGLKAKDIKDLKAKSELLKALENHITELTNDYNSQKKTFQSRIVELEQSVSRKEEELKIQTQAKQTLEASLAEAEEKIRNVREKKKVFSDMVDKTKQILQTTNSGSTKREEQLWTELEATKIIVKGYQDQINKLNDEKNRILLKFQTISEDKSNQNAERLAADLVRKEEIIKNLKDQVTQLQTACEEHSTKYNKLLAQIKEVHEKMDGKTDAAALSKQLGDIKIQKKQLQEAVKDLMTHNEELGSALAQRSLELDQRDRLVKQQCNLLKMRDELTDLVRSKDDAQYQGVKKVMEHSSRWERKAERIYKDLEKKANELDDMYKILIDKQKQVEKLTKLVKIMEGQQDRAQEQRVRLESKIAELQRRLSEGKQKPTNTPLFGN